MMVIVAKFGGTSLKDGPTIEHVVRDIILKEPARQAIVVSAPGKRTNEDSKVTDLLIQAGSAYWDGLPYGEPVAMLTDRFHEIARHFDIEPSFIEKNLVTPLEDGLRRRQPDKEQYLDQLRPLGEIVNAQLLARVLQRFGVKARVGLPEDLDMITDGVFGNARLLEDSFELVRGRLFPQVRYSDAIVVIPGYYGVDANNRRTTFPRGGSDLTGSIVARALRAETYENWTDTPIRRADPRIIPDAEVVRQLTYREARELAYSGAEVLHPDTLLPVMSRNIPINVRNTFEPYHSGTMIKSTKDGNHSDVIEAIAHKPGFTILYLEKMGMNEQVGYINRLTSIFLKYGLSIDQTTTSIDSISLGLVMNGRRHLLNNVIQDVVREGLVDGSNSVQVQEARTMVCVVGEGMRHVPGVMSRISTALAGAGVNIEHVYQGPSERNVTFGVAQEDGVRAVKAIYNEYFRPLK